MGVSLLVENDFGLITEILTFDVTISEQHEGVSQLTEFPVEEGASITDHIRKMPLILSAEVFVSNHPIRPNYFKFRGRYEPTKLDLPTPFNFPALFPGFLMATPGAGTRAALNAIEGRMVPPIVVANLLTFDAFDIVGETYTKLEEIRKNGAKLRIVTSRTEYTDMYLVHVGSPVNIDDGEGGTFQIDMQQVRKVSPLSVEAPAIPLEANGGPKKNRGGVGATLVDTDKADKVKRSLAVALAETQLDAAGLIAAAP